jgi:hypothetical protein
MRLDRGGVKLFRRFLQYCGTQIGNCVQGVKNTDQLNALIDRWNGLPACPVPYSCLAGGAIARVPSGTNFFSPFSSFDLRLNKVFKLTERASFSLIGEGFQPAQPDERPRNGDRQLLRPQYLNRALPVLRTRAS